MVNWLDIGIQLEGYVYVSRQRHDPLSNVQENLYARALSKASSKL